jgi:hypothetical protein
MLCLLNRITETVEVTDATVANTLLEGRMSTRGWSKASLRLQHKSAALSKGFLV